MKRFALALAALPAAPLVAADKPAVPSPSEIVAAAPSSEWKAIAASDLLVMDLAPGPKSEPRRVVIQLIPPPFSQGWVGNIRKLAAAHWWDGLSVYRVQDNYVAQWGDAEGEDRARARALPARLAVVPESEYVARPQNLLLSVIQTDTQRLDAYANGAVNVLGWPLAYDREIWWPVHCYGMVGVARDLSPDTGTGAELYTVIGHAPRQLDRNIALVGRVIEGIQWLSSLPRGTGPSGFYETAQERTPIARVRLASDLPEAERPRFEYLSTEGETFARYAEAVANRRDPFFIQPAGGADICNIRVPVRRSISSR
jgi:peptidylprolyl isomerase